VVTGNRVLVVGRVLHVEVFLRGRRLLCSLGAVWFCAKASLHGRRLLGSLGAVWFCAKASLRGRRPLCSLGAVYLGMVGTSASQSRDKK